MQAATATPPRPHSCCSARGRGAEDPALGPLQAARRRSPAALPGPPAAGEAPPPPGGSQPPLQPPVSHARTRTRVSARVGFAAHPTPRRGIGRTGASGTEYFRLLLPLIPECRQAAAQRNPDRSSLARGFSQTIIF